MSAVALVSSSSSMTFGAVAGCIRYPPKAEVPKLLPTCDLAMGCEGRGACYADDYVLSAGLWLARLSCMLLG